MKWTMSEADLQKAVIDLARIQGWKVMEARKSEDKHGRWRTSWGADGVGWPDLAMVSGDRRGILFVECKSDVGKLTPEQAAWISAIQESGGQAYVWRPDQWRDGTIERVLGDDSQEAGA